MLLNVKTKLNLFCLGAMFVCSSVAVGQDSVKLDGLWRVAKGKMHGVELPPNVMAAMSLNINSTSFSATSAGLNSIGIITTDTSATPARITFTINQGAGKAQIMKGIFDKQEKVLKITFSQDEKYPSTFDSSAENRYLQLDYETGPVSYAAVGSGARGNSTARNGGNGPGGRTRPQPGGAGAQPVPDDAGGGSDSTGLSRDN